MARRNTTITLYSTGRVDPTYKNIIGFNSEAERNSWLSSKPAFTISKCKYWRVGDALRMPLTYDKAFLYDYAKIVNHTGEASQEVYYAFIVGRSYVNDGMSLLAVDVDWVQTYYFTVSADGGKIPFFNSIGGFLNVSTQAGNPPRGTPAEYNIPESVAYSFLYNTEGYSVLVYSTVDLRSYLGSVPSDPTYASGYTDGGILTAYPYLIYGAGNTGLMATMFQNIFRNLNAGGVTDAIQGAYMIPNIVLADTLTPGTIVIWSDNYGTEREITLQKPTACDGYTPINSQLLGYDYTYITVNNGQGETAKYNFEDFNGNPTFICSLSVASGSPVIMLRPGMNYIYGNINEYRQRMMKITQAPAVSWLNDSYAIWLAQTQNSRAAAIQGANIAISQAQEARSKSWAYKMGGTVRSIENALKEPVVGLASNAAGGLLSLGSGIKGFLTGDNSVNIPVGNNTTINYGKNNGAGVRFGDATTGDNTYEKTISVRSQEGAADAFRPTMSGLYDLGMMYLNHELGIETTYTFDHAVVNAQHSLDALLAGYADKAKIPASAVGSNAYGDVLKYQQYGFMITVWTPTAEYARIIDNMLSANGHTINTYVQNIFKAHRHFDYWKFSAAKLSPDPNSRPEFVRRLMLSLFDNGVYIWYLYNANVSDYWGSPYGLSNP